MQVRVSEELSSVETKKKFENIRKVKNVSEELSSVETKNRGKDYR